MYKITVYTKPGCNECRALMQYLASNEIQFTEKNIQEKEIFAKEAANLVRNTDRLPIIIFSKAKERAEHPQKEIIVGFDQERISELIEEK